MASDTARASPAGPSRGCFQRRCGGREGLARGPSAPPHHLSPTGHPLTGAVARALGAVSLNAAGQCVENLGLSAMVVGALRGRPTKWCYSCRQCHFPSLHRLFRAGFGELGNVLLPATPTDQRSGAWPCRVGGLLEFRYICGAGALRQASCYALSQGWLLPSLPTCCRCTPTSSRTGEPLGNLSGHWGLCPSRQATFAPPV